MIVRVIKTYRDKYTRKIMRSGEKFETNNSRTDEINSSAGGPYVEVTKDGEPAKRESKKGK